MPCSGKHHMQSNGIHGLTHHHMQNLELGPCWPARESHSTQQGIIREPAGNRRGHCGDSQGNLRGITEESARNHRGTRGESYPPGGSHAMTEKQMCGIDRPSKVDICLTNVFLTFHNLCCLAREMMRVQMAKAKALLTKQTFCTPGSRPKDRRN